MKNTSSNIKSPSRRRFIVGSAVAGGGLALGFHLPLAAGAQAKAAAGAEVNAWVVVRPDDTCVIRIARSEMGQGTLTGLAQLVAEELECDWNKVATEMPTPGQNLAQKRIWGEMGTGGSRGIRTSEDYVRRGGAVARTMLLQAAANGWQVPVAELAVADGIITHAASGRTTSYGKVAAAAAKLTPPDGKSIKLKDPKQWKVAGKPMKRLDTAEKLKTGAMDAGAWVPMDGPLADAVWEVARTQFPRENFTFDQIGNRDYEELWAIGANQRGMSEDSTRTATELNIVDRKSSVRLDAARRRVMTWFIKGTRKFASLLQMFA